VLTVQSYKHDNIHHAANESNGSTHSINQCYGVGNGPSDQKVNNSGRVKVWNHRLSPLNILAV